MHHSHYINHSILCNTFQLHYWYTMSSSEAGNQNISCLNYLMSAKLFQDFRQSIINIIFCSMQQFLKQSLLIITSNISHRQTEHFTLSASCLHHWHWVWYHIICVNLSHVLFCVLIFYIFCHIFNWEWASERVVRVCIQTRVCSKCHSEACCSIKWQWGHYQWSIWLNSSDDRSDWWSAVQVDITHHSLS